MLAIAYIETPLGITKIEGDSAGIQRITTNHEVEKPSEKIPESLQHCVSELQRYFEGSLKEFTFQMNPQGTEFQQKVWKALLDIPFGKTTSYADLSIKLGDIKAIRAVANANGKNPLWIAVPCHRVIGSDGSLTGYAGGLWRKQWLLEHENPVKQQTLF